MLLASVLVWAALWSFDENADLATAQTPQLGVDGDTVARALRVLRRLITCTETDATREQRAPGEDVPVSRFVRYYHDNALRRSVFDLLMAANCTRGGHESSPVMRELLLMHASPECSKLFTDTTLQHRLELIEAGNDVTRFAQGFAGGWREAFDAYIAAELERHGFSRCLPPRDNQIDNCADNDAERTIAVCALAPTPSPPLLANGAPSAAALSLMQRRARLLVRSRVSGLT